MASADYISREALRDALYEADAITMKGVAIINQFPAADVRPNVTGRWIRKHHNMMGPATPCCSECGKFEPMVRNFYPNCGADMREES